MDRKDALEEVRKRMKEKKGGRTRDPHQFTPPKAQAGEELKFKFYVLPGLAEGEACASGKATKSMDLWYTTVGTHWINQKPYECPRAHDGMDCPFCQLGFDLLKDTEDDDVRQNIVKTYLARNAYPVNIYFPPFESTPPELRGKVMWYQMPKTIFDIMESTIMRDSAGDDTDPQAFGLFFDPMDAYLFQLTIRKQGDFNDYKQSKFLPNTKGPMVKDKEGNASEAAIAKVLSMRHDLFTKFAPRDVEALAKRASEVLRPEPDRSTAQVEDKLVETETTPEPVTESKPAQAAKAAAPATKPTPPAAKAAAPAAPTTPAAKAAPTPPPAKPAPQTKVVEDPDDEELTKLLNDIRTGS